MIRRIIGRAVSMLIEKQATVVKETIFLWQMIVYINRKKDENNEQPMLLDPCVAEDVKLLSFLGNRVVSATDDELGKERVRVSASIYNLTDAYISNERGKIWENIEQLLAEYDSGDISKSSCIRQLRDAISPKAPFSACAIACVNSLAPDEIKSELNLML